MSDQAGEMPSTAPQAGANLNEAAVQETEAEFDAKRAMALIEKLRAEIRELKPKAKQAEELTAAQKQKEEAEMAEVQKLSKRLAEAESALKTERRAALAATVAARLGVPAALADRLKGETAEELEADAKAILESLPKPIKPAQPGPLNPGVNGTTKKSNAEIFAELTGGRYRSPNLEGGGVKWANQPPD